MGKEEREETGGGKKIEKQYESKRKGNIRGRGKEREKEKLLAITKKCVQCAHIGTASGQFFLKFYFTSYNKLIK